MATFNEFQRELQKRGIEPNVAYMFTLVYERLAHLAKEHEDTVKCIVALTESVQGFVNLREKDRQDIERLMRQGRPDGVEVMSVANDPETEH